MRLQLSDSEITIGADKHPLSGLDSFKIWLGNDAKTYLKVVPENGKHEMYEIEPNLTFKDMDGEVVDKVDYFIITWHKGMAKPACVIRIGDMTGKGTFEQKAPEPERKKRGRSYDFDTQPEGGDDGA